MSDEYYKQKYLKYKAKYMNLRRYQRGGAEPEPERYPSVQTRGDMNIVGLTQQPVFSDLTQTATDAPAILPTAQTVVTSANTAIHKGEDVAVDVVDATVDMATGIVKTAVDVASNVAHAAVTAVEEVAHAAAEVVGLDEQPANTQALAPAAPQPGGRRRW